MAKAGGDQRAGRRAKRTERLADKLRQNLVRRKAKTRVMREAARASVSEGSVDTGTEPSGAGERKP